MDPEVRRWLIGIALFAGHCQSFHAAVTGERALDQGPAEALHEPNLSTNVKNSNGWKRYLRLVRGGGGAKCQSSNVCLCWGRPNCLSVAAASM